MSRSQTLTGPAEDDVEVESVDADAGVVLDAQVDVLLDAEAEVAGVGEVALAQLVLAHLQGRPAGRGVSQSPLSTSRNGSRQQDAARPDNKTLCRQDGERRSPRDYVRTLHMGALRHQASSSP